VAAVVVVIEAVVAEAEEDRCVVAAVDTVDEVDTAHPIPHAVEDIAVAIGAAVDADSRRTEEMESLGAQKDAQQGEIVGLFSGGLCKMEEMKGSACWVVQRSTEIIPGLDQGT